MSANAEVLKRISNKISNRTNESGANDNLGSSSFSNDDDDGAPDIFELEGLLKNEDTTSLDTTANPLTPTSSTRKFSLSLILILMLTTLYFYSGLFDQAEILEEIMEEPIMEETEAIVVETKDKQDTEAVVKTEDEKTVETPTKEDAATTTQDESVKNDEAIDWGAWKFYDGDVDNRPKGDYCGEYPNRDIPGDNFPDNAWQTDAVYVNHFVDEALKLTARAREAILAEYGHGEPRTPEQTIETNKMFHVQKIDLAANEGRPAAAMNQGGWSTDASFHDLMKRLLHAMMTNDDFTVVMGGHSAAAGHGNHFKQSYMMQFHEVMAPILAKFGVKLKTQNLAQGGLGTIQSALGSRSIYGDEIDVLLWDSGMTEPDNASIDIFYRQALMGSKRPPFLLCLGCINGRDNVLRRLHTETGVGVGELGSAFYGVTQTIDSEQVKQLPWAVQCLQPSGDMTAECRQQKITYRSMCWIDRDDVTPATRQSEMVGGQASWHPGWRQHRLTGRVLAMWFLQALEQAFMKWMEVTIVVGDPLPDEHWHLTEDYEKIKKAVFEMKNTFCEQKPIWNRVCYTPLYGRTEFTPRNDPDNTSIRSLLKPAADGYVPQIDIKPQYTGEDLPIPTLQEPEGAIDVVKIVSKNKGDNRRLSYKNNQFQVDKRHLTTRVSRQLDEAITPGLGWTIPSGGQKIHVGFCDGSYDSVCGRGPDRDCLLSGHNDSRGTVIGDGLSGWIVMTLKDLKEGLIILNLDFWHGTNPRTRGWKEVNNGKRALRRVNSNVENLINSTYSKKVDRVSSNDRRLVHMNEDRDPMTIDYAINGKITHLDQDEFDKKYMHVQRIVELVCFLDDPNFTNGQTQDVEFAIRVGGCTSGDKCSLNINHVYWA